MIVTCPHCGGMVVVNGLGRKAFNMPVINICDALQLHRSVAEAANELGCSRAYIYKVLKAAGLTPADAIKGHATKDMRLLHNDGLNDGL
jgi:AraC-like DNA-binding protein